MSDSDRTVNARASAHALFDEGNACFRAGDLQGAAARYRRALEIDPCFAEGSFNLGCAVDHLAGPAEAIPHFGRAAKLRPEWCEARGTLGYALARVGRMAEAVTELKAAAALRPEDASLRNNLGLALSGLGCPEEAYASFREAIRLNPRYPEAHNNLAILFERYGRTSDAIDSCLEALKLRPDYPEAHHNLASALKSQGRHQEALAHFREALRLRPEYLEARSSLLFSLCYPASVSEQEVVAEHLAFGELQRLAPPAHDNNRSANRPLRIGYVSADFRTHAVARFIEPVLRHHDRSRFQVILYSNVAVPDRTSLALEKLADRFVNIAGMPDHAASELIRRDRVDILVDLSGHSAGNRLTLFAMKPAPVQATWLGYPHTTGLSSVDYRITDAVTDPPGAEPFYSEKLYRLPRLFCCFAPPEEAPEVREAPSLSSGTITFGSFNNPAKITPETVALWAGVLLLLPGSRMLVKGYSLADGRSRARLLALFARHGVTEERLELSGNLPSYRDHLSLYHRVDIALDTFPYHGTTTTCEALWMGVPVVTLAGEAHRSRVGASLLRSLGLDELVARREEEYLQAALSLARDPGRLARLRMTLRRRIAASPLADAAGFTRELEEALREMWRSWVDGKGVQRPLQRLLRGGPDEGMAAGRAAAFRGAARPAAPAHTLQELGMGNGATAEMQARLRFAELLLRKGMQEEARVQLKDLVRDAPFFAEGVYRLAVLRAAEGESREAVELFRQALTLVPEEVRVLNGLGVALQQLGRDEEAGRCYQEALKLDPCCEDARINLALLLHDHAMLCAAERELAEGLRLRPDSVRLSFNLANILQFQGRSLDAVSAYRRTLMLDPEHLGALQNLLFALQYSPRHSDRELFEAHVAAAQKAVFNPGAPPRFAKAETSPNRRIRIGYVSPDFREHAVARFIEPVLAHHDRRRFEIFCYANVARPDRTTERLKGLASQWRDIQGVSDEHAAGIIARDGIDILIDLAGHSAGNRLPLFALKPAPLQGSWIGYPATTGLPQMDFRITDSLADPPGAADDMHSERLIRLPRSFSCYQPPADSPEVGPLPMAARGGVTFGSFNNLAKANHEVIALWGRLLLAIPGSRLLMKCRPLDDPEVCDRIRGEFGRAGVDPSRVTLQGGTPSTWEHLAQYHQVDIALDTFPYNGTTTTCEALWMGVPVVTLAGTRHAARTGVSLLTNCGLTELIAKSEEEYLTTACGLAQDPVRLLALRRGLRPRLQASPVMDARGITRELEDALLSLLPR